MTKVMIIANDESTILNFRLEILKAFIEENYQVFVCYPLGLHTDEIKQTGCEVIDIKVSRHGKNIVQDLKLIQTCRKLIKQYHPDVVLTYTVKPNIYGSIACQVTKTPYINNVTGLGSVLQNQNLLSKLILILQKFAYKKSSCVFFQNVDNCERLKQCNVISENIVTKILPGSGVNLKKQTYEEFPKNDGITKFIIVSRIRRDKGYKEFFEAAERIKDNYPNTEFHVVGWYEEEELRTKVDELNQRGIVIYHGQKIQDEVHKLVAKCNCLVHPSYHEGMANVLLEAAATGRPVIATNIPGCRETFDEGKTGYGCQVKDVDSLVEAMEKVILTSYEKQIEMGKLGRIKMEMEFDRRFVAQMYIEEIRKVQKRKR